ncbi:hypothetical protein Pmani_026508 [Petrolisthes manimaculis]|uniref:Uncharacterized protein n=1 Tax=Petrolisthes manimaculis TaxID=1843537 RepID=A0AAE1P513_9EUCA|nr:hypothetical protein Pmani_026508 [Petrolisthes manimaculis]
MLPCRGLDGNGGQDDAYPPSCFPPTHTTSTSYHSHITDTPNLLHTTDTPYLSHTTADNSSLASPPLSFSPFPTRDVSLYSPHYPSYHPPPYLPASPDTTSFPSPVTSSLTTSHLSVHSPEALTSVAWQESVDASGPIMSWEEVELMEETGDTQRTTTSDGRTTSDRDDSTTAVAEGSQGRRPKTYRSHKLKVYEWPPQDDPQLEQKRLRAVREFRKRQKEDEEERELTNTLHTTREETRALKQELIRRRQEVEALERQVTGALSQLQDSPHYGHSSQS